MLPNPANVRLTVLDVRGAVARTLLSGAQPAGARIVRWDGRNDSGARLPSGVYFVRLEVEGKAVASRLVTFLR
ncbi:MAG TPA: FlgD immunoglobulin-like domain containing protein [Candidatus Eisenbacteria bacterium]|nr:FlgD immunoglobulin-like domain containing protein [Candidatus Eisenbacteria bacterium]